MKVVLCTNSCYRKNNYSIYTYELKKKYCQKFDIKFVCNDEQYSDYPNDCVSLKMVLENLKQQVQWVIWMDVSTAPLNMSFNIKEYLLNEQKKVLISKDFNGLNSDVYAVPNTQEVKQWLKNIYEQGVEQKLSSVIVKSLTQQYIGLYKIPPISIGFNTYLNRQKVGNTFIQQTSWCLNMTNCDTVEQDKIFGYYRQKLVDGGGIDKQQVDPKILYAITTYDGYAYVDLNITQHKKFGNDVIVIDDGSLSKKLREVCFKHNVPLFNNCVNSCKKFDNGDVISTTQAIQYAYYHGYDYVVKQSRRFVFVQNPTPSLKKLIQFSDGNTFSTQYRTGVSWGFTTCCVAYKTSVWIKTIEKIFKDMELSANHGLTEHYIHVLAQRCQSTSQLYRNYMERHPSDKDARGYVYWQFIDSQLMLGNLIWHFVHKPIDYYKLSLKVGLNYSFDDYNILDSHSQWKTKKRPML